MLRCVRAGSFRRRRLKRRVVLTSLQGSDRGLRATPGTPGSHHSGSTYASTPMSSRGGVGASRDALPADTPTSTTTLQRMQSGRARPHTAAALGRQGALWQGDLGREGQASSVKRVIILLVRFSGIIILS